MDLSINNMILNINKLKDNKEDNFKKLFIIKKINEINDICESKNYIELKNNEIKEEIENNNQIKKILPYIMYINMMNN